MKAEMTRRAGAGVWTQKPGMPPLGDSPTVECRGRIVSSGGQAISVLERSLGLKCRMPGERRARLETGKPGGGCWVVPGF